jgi:hypothetical protein
MALNKNTFSGKQFEVYLASEVVTGTFNTEDADYRRVDVEGITFPAFAPQQEFEMRSGSSRIAEFDAIFSSSKRVKTEFTLSGRLTQEFWNIMMENVTGEKFDGGASVTVGSGSYDNDPTITHASATTFNVGDRVTSSAAGIPDGAYVASITDATHFELSVSTTDGAVSGATLTFSSESILTIDGNYNGVSIGVGDNPQNNRDFTNLLSVYFQAPTVADSYSMKSCTCTNFSIDGDMDSAAGRLNYSATFTTGSTPAKGVIAMTDSAAIGANTVFLSLLDDKNIDVYNYSGTTDQLAITPLFKTFNMAIDCPTQFLGATGANGEPEVWGKALPELSITWGGAIKYDIETDKMIEAFRDPNGASFLTFYLADVPVHGTGDSGAIVAADYLAPSGTFFDPSSVNKLGMWFGKSKLTSAEVSSDDVAMVNFEAKVLAPASGNTAHFLGGDNVSAP